MNRFLMGFDDDAALVLLLDQLGDVVLDQFGDVVHVPTSLKFRFQVMGEIQIYRYPEGADLGGGDGVDE